MHSFIAGQTARIAWKHMFSPFCQSSGGSLPFHQVKDLGNVNGKISVHVSGTDATGNTSEVRSLHATGVVQVSLKMFSL